MIDLSITREGGMESHRNFQGSYAKRKAEVGETTQRDLEGRELKGTFEDRDTLLGRDVDTKSFENDK